MAAFGWGTNRSLEEFLFEEGHRFDFYQAVKLLEILHPGKLPVGKTPDPMREAVRFKSKVRMDFPPSEVEEIARENGGAPPVMTVNFMGLATGANSPLPAAYTDLIVHRISQNDTAIRDFLDIFNHRLVSLMYRARKKFHVGFDFKPPDQDGFASFLFSLIGLNTPGLQTRMRVKDRALPLYAGILATQTRSMAGLETILGHYFQFKVRGEPFCGQWYNLEDDQFTLLGPSGQNQLLGVNTALGARAWDIQGKFRLHIGPLTFERFLDILPVGSGWVPLCELTRFFAGQEFDFEFRLALKAADVPESRLGGKHGPRLGWTSWLKTREFSQDDNQVALTPRSGFFVPGQRAAGLNGLGPDGE
ncbi:MAG: type VI secretion system baseplate subunit TssG [Nitrospinae bacterium]|nr:type VI secretion system baseplate subunit TssG [Nitrospinota bacterium]